MAVDAEFGPDTETIRAWLAKRATYADAQVVFAQPVSAVEDSHRADRSLDEREIDRAIVDAVSGPTSPAHPSSSRWREAPTRPATGVPTTVPTGPDSNRSTSIGTSVDTEFQPRRGARRAMAAILLACLAATGGATYLAVREQTAERLGLTAILAVLTLVVWAVLASVTSTRLALRRGQLYVERGGVTEVVDVGNPHTPLAVVGEPGQRRWTVLVERPGQPLLVITRAMVDPRLFTDALYRLRPDLARAAAAGAVGTQ